MGVPGEKRSVVCYHCQRVIDVGVKALTASCPLCSKRVVVQDIIVKAELVDREIRTCGSVVVERKARLACNLLEASGSIEVLGEIDAAVISHSHVFVGAKARWRGACRAPFLVVEPGAQILGGRFEIVPQNAAALRAHERV